MKLKLKNSKNWYGMGME